MHCRAVVLSAATDPHDTRSESPRREFIKARLERLQHVTPQDLPASPEAAQELFCAILPLVREITDAERRRTRRPPRVLDDSVQDACLGMWRTITTLRSLEFDTVRCRARLVVRRASINASLVRTPLIESDGFDKSAASTCATSRTRLDVVDDFIDERAPDSEVLADAGELHEAVAAAMASLPPRQRDVIASNVLIGETIASIAKRHEVDERTTRRDLRHGVSSLQRLLRRFSEPELI